MNKEDMPLLNHHWGRCPQTPGVYRFKGIKRGREKKDGADSTPPLRHPPATALRLLPSRAVSSERATPIITRVVLEENPTTGKAECIVVGTSYSKSQPGTGSDYGRSCYWQLPRLHLFLRERK